MPQWTTDDTDCDVSAPVVDSDDRDYEGLLRAGPI